VKPQHLILASFVLVGCSGWVDGEPPVDSITQPVEQVMLGSYFDVSLAPAGDDGPAQRATGAALVPLGYIAADGVTPVQASCGVTFVSPKKAVGAAHCVDTVAPGSTIKVRMFRMRSTLPFLGATTLTGTWPNFVHSPVMTASQGYLYTDYDCRVIVRCGAGWSPLACDLPDADTAVLECDGSPGDRFGYIDIAETDDPAAEVRMAWKHELYSIPDVPGDSFFEHYSRRSNDRSLFGQNFHYFGNEKNQLLPLMSKPAAGAPRVKTSVDTTRTWTTLRGCHGTSGSGVMQPDPDGGWQLLGPATNAANMPGDRLCHTTDSATAPGLAYPSLAYTRSAVGPCVLDERPPGYLFYILCHTQWLELFNAIQWKPWPFPECPACGAAFWTRMYDERMAWIQKGKSLSVPLKKPVAGKRYRVGLRVIGSAQSAPTVKLVMDGQTLVTQGLQGVGDFTTLLSASFVATSASNGDLVVSSVAGDFGVNEITLVPDQEPNRFDSMIERSGLGLRTFVGQDPKLVPMRVSGDASGGFLAELALGERMLLTRQAFLKGKSWNAKFDVPSGGGSFQCGFLHENGTETKTTCTPVNGKVNVTLTPSASMQPLAFFIERSSGPLALLDNLQVSMQ
jgi:hypothetical protein